MLPTIPTEYDSLLKEARELDSRYPASFRDEFHYPEGQVYFDGNSLGLMCKGSEISLLSALNLWRDEGIGGWTSGESPWYTMAESVSAQMAPLVGASAESVAVCASTSICLHQALATLYKPDRARRKILCDGIAFPTDRYAIDCHLRLHNLDPETDLIVIQPGLDGLLPEDDIISKITDEVALILLPMVVYTTGQLLDVARISEAARKAGAIIGIDCAHSIGAVEHQMEDWGVDFAVWCGYKYLNGGPGSSAGMFLHPRHHLVMPGLAGWFGVAKDRQFEMSPTFHPASGAARLQSGTPNILSLAPLIGSLELTNRAGIENLRERSLRLTDFLIKVADEMLTPHGFHVGTPGEHSRRGGHVALRHELARGICTSLREIGVVPDFRPANIVRLAPTALYNTFEECVVAAVACREVVLNGLAIENQKVRQIVT